MDQRNFKSTKNTKRSEKGFLVPFGRGSSNAEGEPESPTLDE
jgi:hypothetical protein